MQNSGYWVVLGLIVLVLVYLKQRGQVPAGEVRGLLDAGGVVVDVRSAGEYAADHLDCSVNVPLGELERRIREVAPDSGKPVLVHCLSGTRSAMACGTLRRMGYVRVENLGSLSRARSLCQEAGRR